MSSIEERLARDIAAVNGSVVVTESDLRMARDAVEKRIDSGRQRNRRRTLAAAAAAAVVIPVLGFAAFQTLRGDDKSAPPANPGPTTSVDTDTDFLSGDLPTPGLVNGLWRVDNGTLLMLFNSDGTMRFDNAGALYSDPAVTGTYDIEGELITVSIGSGPAECLGQELAMRASLPAAGEMRFVHTQPVSENCAPAQDKRLVLEQVLPTYNDALAGFEVPAKGDWQSPAGLPFLYGDWMAKVTDPVSTANTGGLVLELAPDGSYTFAGHGAVADRGRWTFDSPASRLSLVSAGDSPTCDQGDRLVLGAVEHLYTGTTLMRATVEQNTCGGAWASHDWILLPREVS